jgi:cellulose synthase/poly-beta-1,6-N-acetylglucosamine synthase-like glycosyltransferase
MLEYDVAIISIILAAVSLFYYIINSYMALSYKDTTKNPKRPNPKDVTILVPVYNEDKNTFTKCIEAIKNQNTKFIVVGDGVDEPYNSITKRNGGTFIFLKKNGGQRKAHAAGIKKITTKYVLFVDSDTIIPANTLTSMLSKFDDNVGGMGTGISIKLEDNWVSYCAEFFQRAKEIVFKAMASEGRPIFVIGGRCCLYRVDAIKNFMGSDEFLENRIFGKKCVIAEDMHITSHILKSGYKAVIDYDVNVVTDSQKSFKMLFNQMVRWARGGYLYFFKDLTDGSYIKKGALYSFEMFYIYLLPTVLIIAGLLRLRLMLSYGLLSITSGFSGLSNLILLNPANLGSLSYLPLMALILNMVGVVIFVLALSRTITKKKLKTIAAGSVASIVMLCASMYALLTVWEQEAWLTK